MSCYEWESGSIQIPSAQWAKFRRSLIDHYNAKQEELYVRAKKEYKKLLVAGKGKRNFDFRAQLRTQIQDIAWEHRWPIENSMFEDYQQKRPKSPKRKGFEKATTKTRYLGENVSFDHEKRTVIWNVPDGNRACEDARDSYMGKKFFYLLRYIKWTRGSGGKIIGNDEYNREAEWEGGGGNYVTATFGPAGKKRFADYYGGYY